ncbi:MAG: hypothetical protein QOK43_26 [Acidimicrobiaceae bacterium]|nr:hypothetical protein [Acidimicrobiaceae bacterium]
MVVTVALGLFALAGLIRMLDARRQLTFARSDLERARGQVVARRDDAARRSLATAASRVAQARRAADSFPLNLVRPVPVLGAASKGLADGAEAAAEAVAAGRMVAQAAGSFPTRLNSGLSGSDLTPFAAAATRSQAALTQAESHVAKAGVHLRGPKGAALPVVSRPARQLAAELAKTSKQLDGARRGMALLADLAGSNTDARLLVLAQDSLELRPTGGYIGSYGILHFAHGTVALEQYQDTQLLPPPQPAMEPPADLAVALPSYWSITNSNWWPDFPTSAQTAREMFNRQGGGQVDGVIGLTEYATARMVGVVGPLNVPGYDKPVTEEGFDRRVVYEVELKRPQDEPRKRFLTVLADTLFDRVFHLQPGEVPALTKAMDRSVAAGDIQLWFADPARQAQLAGTVIEGALPKTDRDFLMLVDANLSASKANLGLVKDVTYRARRRKDGKVAARLEATVRNGEPQNAALNPYYNGYLRVYVPLAATLSPTRTGQVDAGRATDGPYRVFTQVLDIQPEATQKVTFDYLLPADVAPDGDYRLTWVRQAGTPRDSLTAVVSGRTATVRAGERALHVDHTFKGSALGEWWRRRWIVRKLGLD